MPDDNYLHVLHFIGPLPEMFWITFRLFHNLNSKSTNKLNTLSYENVGYYINEDLLTFLEPEFPKHGSQKEHFLT